MLNLCCNWPQNYQKKARNSAQQTQKTYENKNCRPSIGQLQPQIPRQTCAESLNRTKILKEKDSLPAPAWRNFLQAVVRGCGKLWQLWLSLPVCFLSSFILSRSISKGQSTGSGLTWPIAPSVYLRSPPSAAAISFVFLLDED